LRLNLPARAVSGTNTEDDEVGKEVEQKVLKDLLHSVVKRHENMRMSKSLIKN
jgi:hypothetical protein